MGKITFLHKLLNERDIYEKRYDWSGPREYGQKHEIKLEYRKKAATSRPGLQYEMIYQSHCGTF